MKNRTSAPVEVLNALRYPGRRPSRRRHDTAGPSACRRRPPRSEAGRPAAAMAAARRSTIGSCQPNAVAVAADLAGVVEEDQPDRSDDREDLLDVEQQALVAAEHQARREIRRTDGSQVEAAHAVLAAEKQLLEDRHVAGPAVRRECIRAARARRASCGCSASRNATPSIVGLMKLVLPPRPARSLLSVRRLPVRREDRLVHGVVDEARRRPC